MRFCIAFAYFYLAYLWTEDGTAIGVLFSAGVPAHLYW